jgi:hypothetical protein
MGIETDCGWKDFVIHFIVKAPVVNGVDGFCYLHKQYATDASTVKGWFWQSCGEGWGPVGNGRQYMTPAINNSSTSDDVPVDPGGIAWGMMSWLQLIEAAPEFDHWVWTFDRSHYMRVFRNGEPVYKKFSEPASGQDLDNIAQMAIGARSLGSLFYPGTTPATATYALVAGWSGLDWLTDVDADHQAIADQLYRATFSKVW